MNAERWREVERLFHEAATRPASDRAAFLEHACRADQSLRSEVESLLQQTGAAGEFLNEAAPDVAARMTHPAGNPPLTGRRLGVYHLQERIGAGGMGEVYRARDTKLGRDVAIKILPHALTRDPDRLARFEREARVLAALNHPNIATIHGFEDGGDVRGLVMELVSGETLAERIRRRPLSIAECFPVALRIAEALEAAHEKGIIHRDLKPANVKITATGTVKLLDFGLARVATEEADHLTQAPTATANATHHGLIMGTAAYMSPEQSRGQAVDKRTDIWAFGCVLYEMLTGRAAFGRATLPDTLAAIVTSEPDWRQLHGDVPGRVKRLLRRCLEKDPRQRLRDIGDAQLELKDASADTDAGESEAEPTARRMRPLVLVPASSLLAGLLIAGVVMWSLGARFGLFEPPDLVPSLVKVHRLTDARGMEEFPAVSPDGRSVAFVADADGNRHVFVRLLAGGSALQLTHDAADHLYPRWAPDSTSVLYYSPAPDANTPGALWEIPALGGTGRRITSSLGGGDISHDGQRIVFARVADGGMELALSARDGSGLKTIAPLETGYYYLTPRWSRDDRFIAYQRGVANAHEILVVASEGGEPRQITQHGALIEGLTWSATGTSIVFSSSRGATIWYMPPTSLWSMNVDGGNLRQLTFGEVSYIYPDISPAATMVATRVQRAFDIWRYPVDGSPAENVRRAIRITNQTSHVHAPSVAPDDSEVVYVSDSGSHANLWVTKLATGESRQLTFERDPERRVGLPLWSPDRRHIAYFIARGSSYEYFLINADGSDSRFLMRGAGYATWSPDGKALYFYDYPAGKYLKKVVVGGGEPVIVRDDNASRPAIAPDGGTLYYVVELPVVTGGSDLEFRSARPENAPSRLLARIPARRTTSWQPFQPVVSPDGKWLAFTLLDGAISNLWAISTSTGQLRQLTEFSHGPTFITRRASWSSDGQYIFAGVGEGDGDVVLFDGLKP